MKVVFCTLYLGEKPTEPFRQSLEACLPIIEAAGWEHELVAEVNCPYISAARSKVLRKAYDGGADCIVFLDYDLGWTPESMLKLLSVKDDVVAGTYRKNSENEPYMGFFTQTVRDDGCLKALKVPAGFLKINRFVIEKFALGYPQLLFGNPMQPELDMFNHGAIDHIWYGEDYAFSKRWCDIGGEIWVIPDLDIDHYKGGKCLKGNFHKYLLQYNEETTREREETKTAKGFKTKKHIKKANSKETGEKRLLMAFQLIRDPITGFYTQVELPEEEKGLQINQDDVKLKINEPVEPVPKANKGRVK
jgi:hypothetical protein